MCETSKCDINRYHKHIYERYLKESHTWKTYIQKIKEGEPETIPARELDPKQNIIITAAYIPTDVTNVRVRVSFCETYWSETDLDPLESILLDSRKLPVLQDFPGYKRVILCAPFIFTKSSHSFWLDFRTDLDPFYYLEYHRIGRCGVRDPFPYTDYCEVKLTKQEKFLIETGDVENLKREDYKLYKRLGASWIERRSDRYGTFVKAGWRSKLGQSDRQVSTIIERTKSGISITFDE